MYVENPEKLNSGDGFPPLDFKEKRKRKREGILIVFLSLLFFSLTVAEFHLTKVSSTLPFVTSIFFFGLLNINIIILIALVWLISRNIGKLFIERRRKVLGARLKTKLVIAFLAFSLIPTLVLFVISAMYINSSFDKWFSLKIQNTLQASLEITRTYYRNTDQTAMHFAEHLAQGIGKRLTRVDKFVSIPGWVNDYLNSQRELLALDGVEFYSDSLDERVISERQGDSNVSRTYPRIALDLLDKAFAGERVSVMQHVGVGDLIRCLLPVRVGGGATSKVVGVLAVDSYIPVSLVNKVGEIASVFDDYKETNPLKYPMKTTYLVILIMITLVIMLVAVWIGLYMARELTVPVERLVRAAEAVGAGNLDIAISGSGHDEIAVLVESFNKMTQDLRENRQRLTQTGADLEKRRLQLEAVLANIGTGVIAVDNSGEITLFNQAAAQLLQISQEDALHSNFRGGFKDNFGGGFRGNIGDHGSAPFRENFQSKMSDDFKGKFTEAMAEEISPLLDVVDRALAASLHGNDAVQESSHWNFRTGESMKVLAATATPLRQGQTNWGVVVVIDDMTHMIKGQREMAWREVARRIAHEIKNPLTPIKLSAQRLQRRLGDYGGYGGRESAILKECTETIIKHTDELKEMVNEFSNFARFPEASPAPHDLNSAMGEVITLYRQAHTEIHFSTEIEVKMPIFEFDRDQIKRVIINLFDNAVAALRSLPVSSLKRIRIASHYNEQLQMAVIEVEDNGLGMTEEVKARVFEPYFSTKSEGTGLGLSIAKRIVNDHDGFIRVRSAPGEGTQFLIEIPTARLSNFRQGVRTYGFSQGISH